MTISISMKRLSLLKTLSRDLGQGMEGEVAGPVTRSLLIAAIFDLTGCGKVTCHRVGMLFCEWILNWMSAKVIVE
jgi:hypothetical protein